MPRRTHPTNRRPRKGEPRHSRADGRDRTFADVVPDPGFTPLLASRTTPAPSGRTTPSRDNDPSPARPHTRPLDRAALASLLGKLAPTPAHLDYAEAADARLLRVLLVYPSTGRNHLRSRLARVTRQGAPLAFGYGEASRIDRVLIQSRTPHPTP